MKRLAFLLPLLAACALHAQETTVTLSTPSKCLTVTMDVTIPEQAVGTVVSLKTQNQVFSLMVQNVGEQASCYYYDENGELTQTEDSGAFALPAGRHTLTLAYHADNDAATKGTRVWLDGSLVFNADKLRWANNDTGVTSITVGNDAKNSSTAMEGLILHDSPTIDEDSVPNPAPRLIANAGSFSVPTVNLDGSVTIDGTAIALTGVEAASFSAIIDAELPEGATGTLFGWKVGDNNVHVRLDAGRLYLAYGGDTDFALSENVPAAGRHRWTLTYDSNGDGTALYQDDVLLASATGLKWSKANVTQVNIGDAVATDATPLTGLTVYAVRVEMGSTAVPEDTFSALYEVPEALSKVGEAALRHLMMQNGKVGDFSVPAVTLNGKALDDADAARALWLFDTKGPVDLAWHVSGLTLDENGVTLATMGDQPVHGALSVLEKTALNDTWKRVESTQAEDGTLTVPAGGATAFYAVRAEEEAHEPGPVVTLDPTPAAGEGMPSQVFPPATGTAPATATLFNFALAGGTFDEFGENQRTGLTLTLEGNGLVVGGEYTLTVDGKAYTATLEPLAATRSAYNLPHPAGTLTFTGFTLTETSTVSLSGPVVAGQVTVTESSWGVAGQSTRVAVTLADDLVKDGFVPENNSLEMMSYRIPALATDGQGGVLAIYDVRYGSGDLGSGTLGSSTSPLTGIDLGENFSADGGTTWTKPRLGIDVPNFRNPDGKFPNGSDKSAITREMDLGDASILFDPATQKYWLIAMTGGGLHCGYAKTDCVLYTRGAGADDKWEAWTGGQEQGHPRSVKWQPIAYDLRNTHGVTVDENDARGILGGPGHGMVTRGVQGGMPAGTLVFPIQCFLQSNNFAGNGRCGAIYSTDHGATWRCTNLTPSGSANNTQENCIIELDDGSWLMMAKGGFAGSQGKRLFYRSKDHVNWRLVQTIDHIIHVQGSCLRIGEVDGKSRYVMAHQIDPNTRCKLALIFGTDASDQDVGVDWDLDNPVMIFREGTDNKGYVSLCLIDASTLGILYEANSKIYFERFDLTPYLR